MRRIVPPLVFVLLACVTTWPLAAHLTSRFAAINAPGDPYLNLWVMGWDLRTLSLHPSWLFNGRVFDGNIFYPATGTLAYTDHQLPQSIAIWPVYAVTGNAVLCYNLVFLLSLALSAWAMFVFVERVTKSRIAAWVAGLVWGFCPFHFTHLDHIQLQPLYWMPITFLTLDRLVERGRKRDAVAFGAAVAMQALTSVYYGVIGAIALAVAGVLLIATRRMSRRLLGRCALAALVAVAIAAPGLWPYWRLQQEGAGRVVVEAERGSAALVSYVQAPSTNLLYGRVLRRDAGVASQAMGPEQDLFPGFVIVVLAIAGLSAWREPERRPLVAGLVAIGATGFLLSFGPLGIRPLYVALHNYVPGFQGLRVPARFAVLVYFSLAGLGGLGAARLARDARGAARWWPAALMLSVIGLEYLNRSMPYAPAPDLPTASGRWLRDAPEPGPVVYLPIGNVVDDSFAQVASLAHGRPIVNGHSGREPALHAAIADDLATFPSAQALLALRDLSIRFVVARQPVPAIVGPNPVVERATVDDGTIYELRWTPEIEAAVRDVGTPKPLPPGPMPFDGHETARYAVRWIGGPMTVPAGEIVVTSDVHADGGVRIEARVTTAAWMRLFFEANDVLETEADGRLLPRVYRESLNEGRRKRRRVVEFDRVGQHVTIRDGDLAPVTLPLLGEARDPLTALLYIRSLPLAPGFEAAVPVNASGRSSTMRLKVTAASLVIDGHPQDTLRVDPAFSGHLALAQPPRATVWVSNDRRRVPVRIEVSAPFGNVALELVDYQIK